MPESCICCFIYVTLIQVLRGLIQPFDIPMKSWHWINTNDPLRDPRPLPEFARNPSCFMFTKSCRANSHWKPAHVDTPITRGEAFIAQQLKLWQKVLTWSQSVFAEMVFGGSKLLTHDMLGEYVVWPHPIMAIFSIAKFVFFVAEIQVAFLAGANGWIPSDDIPQLTIAAIETTAQHPIPSQSYRPNP